MKLENIDIAKKFKTLVAKKVKIHKFIVFGSRARGTEHKESDLDILIVVVNHIDHFIDKFISDCAWEVGFYEDVVIVPIVISLNKLENTPIHESVFIKNVFREGIAV